MSLILPARRQNKFPKQLLLDWKYFTINGLIFIGKYFVFWGSNLLGYHCAFSAADVSECFL